MAHTAALIAEEREGTGTGVARALRRDGKIPGVIYGGAENPQPIAIDAKTVYTEAHKAGFFSRIYTLELSPKKKLQVIARDIQFHPVTDVPLHVDFQRIDKNSKINVSIPVEYINEDKAPGIKLGGMLNIIVHNLEVVCPADSIPEKITIDLAGININQSIHLDAVALPKGVKAANAARDNTLVTVVPPAASDEKADTATA
jgi:large subunit ribosomal protein L25